MDEEPPDDPAIDELHTRDDDATRMAWRVILEQLAAKFDAKVAQFCYFDMATPEKLLFEVTTGIDFNEDLKARYLKYGVDDPRLVAAKDRPNEALVCRDLVDEETLHNSDIYRHVLEPLGLEYTLWIHTPGPDQKLTVWGVMRGPEGRPFSSDERRTFTDLIPVFRDALSTHRKAILPDEDAS